ncbi:hypothetical protein HK098_001375 [Nowakowskiella sp. JEL0407]|nr:hypothetical protein HK098_001375 [Nowakowskiella sp. JEL0407]
MLVPTAPANVSKLDDVDAFYDWPGQSSIPYIKTPTAVSYSKNGPPYKLVEWGYPVYNSANAKDETIVSRFKLYYDETRSANFIIPPKMDPTKPTTDFLSKMKDFAFKKLESKFGKLHVDEVLWCLTVPAMWTEKAKMQMRKAAYQAGMIRSEGSDNLMMILEPEAAAVYTMHKSPEIKDNNSVFMIVDAGGGTVDITVHEYRSGGLHEVVNGGGCLSGSTFVDENFFEYLKVQIGADVYKKLRERPKAFNEIKDKWESVKRSFRGDEKNPCTVQYPAYLCKLLGNGNGSDDEEDPTLKLTPAKIKEIFRSVLDSIVNCIKEVLAKSRKKCDFMILVGGFSQSDYMKEYVKNKVGHHFKRVINPNQPGAAVVIGSVMYGLQPDIIRLRCARFSYGILASSEAERIFGKYTEDDVDIGLDNVKRVNNLSVFVSESEEIEVGSSVEESFFPIYDSQTAILFEIGATKHKLKKALHARSQVGKVEILGEVEVDIPNKASGLSRSVLATCKQQADYLCQRILGRDSTRKVFLDTRSIPIGTDWKQYFTESIGKAAVVLLLVSKATLESFKDDGREDNVLLEWDISVSRYLKNKLTVIPLFLLEPGESKFDFKLVGNHTVPAKDCTRALNELWEEISKINGMEIDVQHEYHWESFDKRIDQLIPIISPTPNIPVVSSLINVPQACVGREDVMNSISRQFSDTSRAAAAIIFGGPGMGKTTVATRFVSDLQNSISSTYTHILWISFESEFSYQSSLKDTSNLLKLSHDGDDFEKIRDGVFLWFKRNRNYLVLFDNADDPDLLRQCLEKLSQMNGHVLITTRNRAIDNHMRLGIDIKQRTRIELVVWTESVTREYIFSRIDSSSMDSEDEENLDKILKIIDGYPLVVEQMCSYMTLVSGCTFTSYYKKLMAKKLEIHNQVPLLGYSDYQKTLDLTIKIAIDHLNQSGKKGAYLLLTAVAYVSNKRIPRSYLQQFLVRDGIDSDVDACISSLFNISLISLDKGGKSISIHLAVQGVVRRILDSSVIIHKSSHAFAVSVIREAFPVQINGEYKPSTLEQGSSLLPHISELYSTSTVVSGNLDLASLLSFGGLFARYVGSYNIARILHLECLDIYEKVYGTRQHTDIAVTSAATLQEKSIPIGTDWKQYFTESIGKAAVVLLLVSKATLESFKDDGREDNVLLEWDISVSRYLKNKLTVIPLFLLEPGESKFDFKLVGNHTVPAKDCTRALNELWEEISKINGMEIDVQHEYHWESFDKRIDQLIPIISPTPNIPVVSSLINVPQACVGREDVMNSISRQFSDTSRAAAAIIFGGPGMGKTTVATRFVSDLQNSISSTYTHILWISFESEFSYQSSLKDTSNLLNLSHDGDDFEKIRDGVFLWFKRNRNYLVLFDNADDPDLLRQCLEKLSQMNGHVLITTRNRAIDNHMRLGIDIKQRTRIELVVWTESVTREYIFSRIDSSSMDSEDEESLEKILKMIDGYPLVVEQMCSYMTLVSGCTFKSYYKKLMAKKLEIHNQVPLLGYSDYQKTLDLTIKIAIDHLNQCGKKGAYLLLTAVAYVSNKRIPRSYLQQFLVRDGIDSDVDACISSLINISLISLDKGGKSISIHLAVQGVVRRILDSSVIVHKSIHAIAVSVICEAFPERINEGYEPSTLEQGSSLLPHITELYSTSTVVSRNLDLASLLSFGGLFADYVGSYNIAQILHLECLDIYEKVFGTRQHADIAVTLTNALTLVMLRFVEEAEKLFTESLDIEENIYGTRQHSNVAAMIVRLGDIAYRRGDYTSAETFCLESLKIIEISYKTRQHFNVAIVIRRLGAIALQMGDLKKANELILESISTLITVYGTLRHRNIALAKIKLGDIATKGGDYSYANNLYTDAVEIFEYVHGTRKNLDAAPAINNLGILRRHERKYDEALTLHLESLEIYRKFLGDLNHDDIAESLFSLGATYEAMGDFEQAKEKYGESLSMYEKVFGDPNHPLFVEVAEALELLEAKELSMEKPMAEDLEPVITPVPEETLKPAKKKKFLSLKIFKKRG